ncbi:MAG: inositol monophosphatase [Acidobacteria bacterium]|nr:inositol monophosphatase [Acidobacteriota bacterium]
MRDQLTRMFDVAVEAARDAGKLLVKNLSSGFQISKKGRINLVTEMDLQSEQLILSRIQGEFPEHQILAEEQGTLGGPAPYKWVIDPLDGTTNYAHGYPLFAVSIALEYQGRIIFGVVYDPVKQELFSAHYQQGAVLNGRRIQVSSKPLLEDSLVCTGFSYDRDSMLENLEYFNRFIMSARAVRRDGSAALDLCYVACGRFDGMWELSLNPWDVAAGKLIVEEAGGRVSLFEGSEYSIYHRELLATNGRIHDQMKEILSGRFAGNDRQQE